MNIEQLKQILDNAPFDVEYIDADVHEDGNRILTRSLDDIRKIVELSEQVEKLKEVACNYASIDGAHHKQWVINEMLKAVCSDSELEEMGFKDEDWLEECIAP